jgi:uncharacterized 2Fe-2S/4Fe-4S cluster protein (DUF4445 family)
MNASAQKSNARGIRVTFDPGNREVGHQAGRTLLTTARNHDVKITSACGGRGICKTCIVHFVDGHIPDASDSDKAFFSKAKIRKGWRRACQVEPEANCTIRIPARARADSARMQVDGSDFWILPEPVVKTFQLSVSAPSSDDELADADRLIAAINKVSSAPCKSIDVNVLREISKTLRQHDWNVQAILRFDKIIALQAHGTKLIGLAIDLGTTNIGISLIDLHTGGSIASTGIENPQGEFGSDVVSRVSAAATSPSNADKLHHLVVQAVNEATESMCTDQNLSADQIADVVVAGNTAMHHLFLKLPVSGLGLAPFTPVITEALDIKAHDLGLCTATGAHVHMLPNIAGFVGGDHAAMLLGLCADEEKRTVIALDIGTNTEISLIHRGKISSLSCPSGPALEGGHISCGMRAANGAIEAVAIKDDSISLQIIGHAEPVGICGSAVLDIVAAFYKAGGINERGQINQDYVHTVRHEGQECLLLFDGEHPVVFTQKDIRAVQLAKGAIRAGIDLLLENDRLDYDQVDAVVVAGAFGNFIRIDSAITIGMLPDLPLNSFEQVGNAAGIGAKLALLSFSSRETARLLAGRSKHVQQAGNARFNDIFLKSMNFPDIRFT